MASKGKNTGNPPKKNEMETSNLPDKQFIVMIINMIIELELRTDEVSEKLNKEKI